MKKLDNKFFLFYILACFFIINVIFLLYKGNFLEKLELSSIDYRFNKTKDDKIDDNDIIIIDIDNKTVKDFGYPLTRDVFGYILEKARKNNASLVAFDILFDKFDVNNQKDLYFLTQIKKFGKVVLSMHFSRDSTLIFSNEAFRLYTQAEGFINVPTNIDGRIRDIDLFYLKKLKDGKEAYYTSFSAAIYKEFIGIKSIEDFTKHIDKEHSKYNGKLLINYEGGSRTFPYISITELLKKDFDFSIFKDKILLVGPTFSAGQDFHLTPFSKAKKLKVKSKATGSVSTPGIEIHANALNTLLKKNSFKRIKYNYFLFSLGLLIFSLIIIPKFRLDLTLAITFIFVIASYVLAMFTFNKNIIIEVIPLYISISSLFTCSTIFKIIYEQLERKKVKNLFGKYLASEVVNKLLSSKSSMELGGQSKNITILFSDIANFTSISEKFTKNPEKMVTYLNRYFDKMIDIIIDNNGILDKFIGDAVMAIFGAPIDYLENADMAVKTAINMKNVINSTLKIEWKDELDVDFSVRIGVNSGNVIIGNIGSEKRMEYTAIGDNVNLASRLEGVNKMFGTSIIISEFTYNLLEEKSDYFIREIDFLTVKGKLIPIKIYEVIDFFNLKNGKLIKLIDEFDKAIELYRNMNFKEAKLAFEKLEDDSVSKLYVDRCDEFIKNPPAEDWDRVFVLNKK